MKVCEWLGPGYTSINSGKNAFNPYNSVSKFFFLHLFWKFTFGDPRYAHIHSGKNVFIPIMTLLLFHHSVFISLGEIQAFLSFENLTGIYVINIHCMYYLFEDSGLYIGFLK
jgi:hypothetical protein